MSELEPYDDVALERARRMLAKHGEFIQLDGIHLGRMLATIEARADELLDAESRLATLTRDLASARTALAEAVSLLSIGISIAESYSDDDQVGCLCIGDCYCRSGRLEELKQARKSLAARIDALAGEGGAVNEGGKTDVR